jgi:catechol 2,3-dioxygenase-like lactoylglutathione lyase family enzyme
VLQHVSLEVPPDEVERTVEFWCLLGFKQTEAPAPIADYVSWLQRDGTQIHLIHTDSPTVPALGHAAVVPADFKHAVQGLRGAGFEVEDGRQLWGADRAFAIAPGGHRVELMAAPPPASGLRADP